MSTKGNQGNNSVALALTLRSRLAVLVCEQRNVRQPHSLRHHRPSDLSTDILLLRSPAAWRPKGYGGPQSQPCRCPLPTLRASLDGRRATQHGAGRIDRKSTRLNSSHLGISYAVFCLKTKKRR